MGHTLHIRQVRLNAGAGFVVAFAGDIIAMPGLPKVPAAEAIDVDENGEIKLLEDYKSDEVSMNEALICNNAVGKLTKFVDEQRNQTVVKETVVSEENVTEEAEL